MRNDGSEPQENIKAENNIEFLENLINVQREIWQPFYEETLTNNDVTEIHDNIVKLSKLAFRWNKNSNQNSDNMVEFDKE